MKIFCGKKVISAGLLLFILSFLPGCIQLLIGHRIIVQADHLGIEVSKSVAKRDRAALVKITNSEGNPGWIDTLLADVPEGGLPAYEPRFEFDQLMSDLYCRQYRLDPAGKWEVRVWFYEDHTTEEVSVRSLQVFVRGK